MKYLATLSAKQLVCCIALAALAMTATAADTYYRYLDENGVTVMDSKVPPEYVKNGYQVVTVSGQVLKVVPPAPSAEEAEALTVQREREAELVEWDRYLERRYSSVADIEAAKKRKLGDFDASMSILRGNIGGIKARIEDVQARAANAERAGRSVPEVFLENLKNLQAELVKAQQQFDTRLSEKKVLVDEFDRDIERFAEINQDS